MSDMKDVSFNPAIVRQWAEEMTDLHGRLKALESTNKFGTPITDQALAAVRMLFARYAPFQVGDIVQIVKDVACTGGWKGLESSLHRGAFCEVTELRVWGGRFVADVMPLEQWSPVHGPKGLERSGLMTISGSSAYKNELFHVSSYQERYCVMLDEAYLEKAVDAADWKASVRGGRDDHRTATKGTTA